MKQKTTLLFFFLFLQTVLLSAQCPASADAGPDIYVCTPPTPAKVQLKGSVSGQIAYKWLSPMPPANAKLLNPFLMLTQTSTYVLAADALDPNAPNLVVNGDFEQGSTGFSSQFTYAPGTMGAPNTYDVAAFDPPYVPMKDHTTGDGNLLCLVPEQSQNEATLWCQTIPVMPDTYYEIEFFAAMFANGHVNPLKLYMNGILIYTGSLSKHANLWVENKTLWYNATHTSVEMCITLKRDKDKILTPIALDDISMRPSCRSVDSVTVHFTHLNIAPPNTYSLACPGTLLTLHAPNTTTGDYITLHWETATGNIVSGQNSLMPVVDLPGVYTLQLHYESETHTCDVETDFTVHAKPLFATISQPGPFDCSHPQTTLVGITNMPPGVTYQWTALNGGHIVGSTTAHIITVDQPGLYQLITTNPATGCTAESAYTLTRPFALPVASASATSITCLQIQSALSGIGSSSGPGFQYLWTTVTGSITSDPQKINATAGSAGTYILQVLNINDGCKSYDTVQVTSSQAKPIVNITQPNLLECTDTVVLSATVTPASAALLWSGPNIISGSNSLHPRVNASGIYTLTATDSMNGCTTTAAVTIQTTIHLAAVAAPPPVLTCTQPILTLNATGSSTGPGIKYLWSTANGLIQGGATTLTPIVAAPGVYHLLVFDSTSGCSKIMNVNVLAEKIAPQVEVAPAPSLNCNLPSAELTAVRLDTLPNVAFAWTTLAGGNILAGANTLTPTITAAGQYDFVITNLDNGCTTSISVPVSEDLAPPSAQIAPVPALTCATISLQLSATAVSSSGQTTYDWTTIEGNVMSGNLTSTPTVDKAGNYELLVTDPINGCTATASVAIALDQALPEVTVEAAGLITCHVKTFNLQVSASIADLQYLWTASGGGNIVSGNTTATPQIDRAGTYNLLVTNPRNGCTTDASLPVLANTTPPQADAGAPLTLTCTTASATLSGSGSTGANFVYEWTSANGNIISGASTLSPTVNAAGTYVLQITDTQNGCTSTDEVIVQKDANVPTAQIQTPAVLNCKTASVQLNAAGSSQGTNIGYSWTTPDGHFLHGQNTLNPTVDKPGEYILNVLNTASNCTVSTSVIVAENRAAPLAQIAAPQVINCLSSTVLLDGSGSSAGANYMLEWTTLSGGSILSGGNTLAPTVNATGTYSLLITDPANGCTATATVSVISNTTSPQVEAGPNALLTCNSATVALSGSGSTGTNFVYEWTSASGSIVSGANTLNPVVSASGTYTLQITDTLNGCTASDQVLVQKDANIPTALAQTPGVLNCTTTSLTLNGNNSSQGTGFVYDWTTSGGGNILSGNTTLAPTVNQPGSYHLLVTNVLNHCTATVTVAVTQDIATPQVTTNAPLTLHCGTASLSLSATVTGAGSNFETLWSASGGGLILSGQNTLTPTVGAAGTYSVVVKNLQNGCTQTASTEVFKDQNAPTSAAAAPTELTCKTLQVNLSGSGSSTGSNITYAWTTALGNIVSGNTTLAPTVSKPGVYVLAVTNTTNNCTATTTVTVSQNIQPPQATAQSTGLLTCTVKQINLQGSGTGGNSGVAYQWAGPAIVSGANSTSPLVSAAGLYSLIVTDLYNGCTASSQALMGQDVALPVAAVAPPAVLNCLVKTTDLSASVSTPTSGQYSLGWSGPGITLGATSLAPTVNQPGAYALLVTNTINGCTSTAMTSVSQDIQSPLAKASGGFELNCTVEQGTLSAAGSSSGTQFQYAWTTDTGGNIVSGSSSASPVVNAPGAYLLTVNNLQNHCSTTSTVQVTQNTNVPTALLLDRQPPNCQKATGSVQVTEVTGGQGPFLYSLDGGLTFGAASQFKKIPPGSYTLIVQDANGCEHEQPFTFDAPVQPTITTGPDVKMVFGEKSQLTAAVNLPPDQIKSITWSPMEGLTPTPDPLTMIAQPLKSTYYTVKVVNLDGCEAKVTLRVQIDEPHLWAPNVFSPGHKDGNNDFFLLFASDNSVRNIQTLQIFDRWGTMVFQNKDLQPNVEKMGWDGSFRGKTVQPAVFVWYAEVLLYDGRVILMKGDVTVVD